MSGWKRQPDKAQCPHAKKAQSSPAPAPFCISFLRVFIFPSTERFKILSDIFPVFIPNLTPLVIPLAVPLPAPALRALPAGLQPGLQAQLLLWADLLRDQPLLLWAGP